MTKTIDCPFSDYQFISIKIILNASKDKKLEEKALSGLKLDAIKEKRSELNLEINFCQKVNVNLNILLKTYVL